MTTVTTVTTPNGGSIRLLLIAYFIFFVMAIPTGILNVAWTYMQVTFDVPLDALGTLLLANTCGALIGTFFSGRLIERLGLGRYLLIGGVLMGCGLMGYVVAPTWIALIAAGFVTVLGFSAFNAGLNNFVSVRYTNGQFNWLHASFGLGQTVGPTLATIIVEHLGLSWHVSYLVIFALVLFILLTLLVTRRQWVMPGEADVSKSEPSTPGKRVSLIESLRIPAVLLGMSIFFLTSGVIASTGQLSNTLLSARGVAEAGFWISAYWASFTIGRILMGFIANRIDSNLLLRGSLCGATIGALLIWQNASTTVNLVGLMIVGFSCAPLYPTLIAMTHQRVAQRYRLNALGFQMASAGLGQSLVPGAIAWIAQHISVDLIGLPLVIGMLAALALEETAARRRRGVPHPVRTTP